MVTKTHILQEIKRTAEENGGKPLGSMKFESETGIRKHEWEKHWARWNQALCDADLSPNRMQSAYPVEELLDKFAHFARELGKLPTKGDIHVRACNSPGFPCGNTFQKRFRKWPELVEQLREYCQNHVGYDDVVRMCEEYAPRKRKGCDEPVDCGENFGFVYLIKSGRFYKIGKAKDADYRVGAIRLQLPERAKRIHVIRTDDPSGIEAYWHKRFEAKRKNGEWFELNATDVAAFKRRKFM
jgi:hypothetical protein